MAAHPAGHTRSVQRTNPTSAAKITIYGCSTKQADSKFLCARFPTVGPESVAQKPPPARQRRDVGGEPDAQPQMRRKELNLGCVGEAGLLHQRQPRIPLSGWRASANPVLEKAFEVPCGTSFIAARLTHPMQP